MRVPVKYAMLASILTSLGVGFSLQHFSLTGLPGLLLTGYHAADPQAAAFLDGGGISSMVKVAAIVCISSSYAGIFQSTGLLDGLKAGLLKLGKRITPFGAILLASVCTSMIACLYGKLRFFLYIHAFYTHVVPPVLYFSFFVCDS